MVVYDETQQPMFLSNWYRSFCRDQTTGRIQYIVRGSPSRTTVCCVGHVWLSSSSFVHFPGRGSSLSWLSTAPSCTLTYPLECNFQSDCVSDLVGHYMATCTWVSEDRQFIRVSYPSEPVLALAAATVMEDETNLHLLLEKLSSALRNGIVQAEERGALVARILVLLARDRALLLRMGDVTGAATLTVSEFLKSLLGDDALKKGNLPQELLDGVLTFSHFVAVTYDPTEATLKALLERCAAAVVKNNQPGIDFFIPAVVAGGNLALLNFQVDLVSRLIQQRRPMRSGLLTTFARFLRFPFCQSRLRTIRQAIWTTLISVRTPPQSSRLALHLPARNYATSMVQLWEFICS